MTTVRYAIVTRMPSTGRLVHYSIETGTATDVAKTKAAWADIPSVSVYVCTPRG
jgi:hypothetical protein